jgi:hypothetical protein
MHTTFFIPSIDELEPAATLTAYTSIHGGWGGDKDTRASIDLSSIVSSVDFISSQGLRDLADALDSWEASNMY